LKRPDFMRYGFIVIFSPLTNHPLMEENRQEDLDMLTILGSIRKGIVSIGRSIAWLFRFSLSNSLKLLLFIAVAVIVSLAVSWFRKPYFRSQVTFTHGRVNNDFCMHLVKNLDSYINPEVNNVVLATQLKIPVKYAEEVRSFEYKLVNENIARRFADSLTVLLPFHIEVEVYDPEILDTLQNAILGFLESNEYALKHKRIDTEQLDEMEQRIDKEMIETDSLKKLVNEGIVPRTSGNGIILGEPIDPVAVHKRGLELYDRKLQIRKRRLLNNSFEVLVGFNNSVKRASHGRLFYIAIGVAAGYLIGLFYLLGRRSRTVKP
jgi:hypothetical protein